MTEPKLEGDQRWVKVESVETLRECWMIQESQFPTRAHETIKGLTKEGGRPDVLGRKYHRQAHGTTVPVCRNIIMDSHLRNVLKDGCPLSLGCKKST